MNINIRFVPLLGLAVGVGAALKSASADVLAPGTLGQRLQRLQTTFRENWPLILGAPAGTAFVSGIARGFGNPGVNVGPLRFKAF